MRTITLDERITNEFISKVNKREFEIALGYLSSWSVEGFDTVHIWTDRDPGDMVASYTDTKSERRFVMGAIWRRDEGKYSFHS